MFFPSFDMEYVLDDDNFIFPFYNVYTIFIYMEIYPGLSQTPSPWDNTLLDVLWLLCEDKIVGNMKNILLMELYRRKYLNCVYEWLRRKNLKIIQFHHPNLIGLRDRWPVDDQFS